MEQGNHKPVRFDMVADDNGKTVEQVAREMVDHYGADAVLVLRERAVQSQAIGHRLPAPFA